MPVKPREGRCPHTTAQKAALIQLRNSLAKCTRKERLDVLQGLPQAVRAALLLLMERQARVKRACARAPKRSKREARGVSFKGTGYLAQLRIIPHLHAVTQCTSLLEARDFYVALSAARERLRPIAGDPHVTAEAISAAIAEAAACHVRDSVEAVGIVDAVRKQHLEKLQIRLQSAVQDAVTAVVGHG
mmetsp:Transcript_87660/g.203929  ORF Transcript_87660/g.203929 Transcript_87660/m.203929 type:complete len:188 (-) Transcript_87660:182-745(-)